MTLIRARMNRNSVSACSYDQSRKLNWLGVDCVPGITNQRDFIKVNTEACHGAIRLTDNMTIGFTGTS